MTRPARRQHFIARFYLRNFAEPMFSDSLLVYSRQAARWDKRTPNGVGWLPHLFTMIDNVGNRTDEFDRFLKTRVEDPAAPALKKMAEAHSVNQDERAAIALFIALTATRSPNLLNKVMNGYLQGLPDDDRQETEELARIWCDMSGKQISLEEFLKPGQFGDLWKWTKRLQEGLLQWQWHILQTTRDKPFVTSDWPVYAQWDRGQDVRLVSFPVSSEVALIVYKGQFRVDRDCKQDVCALNRGTMERATDLIVSCSRSFPGDDFLGEWQARGDH